MENFSKTSTAYMTAGLLLLGAPSICSEKSNISYEVNQCNSTITSGKYSNDLLTKNTSMPKQKLSQKITNEKDIRQILSEGLNKYSWRTINGLLKETGIPKNLIINELKIMADNRLIFIGTLTKTNEKIYTFIQNYEKNTKWNIKLLDSIRGKIIR